MRTLTTTSLLAAAMLVAAGPASADKRYVRISGVVVEGAVAGAPSIKYTLRLSYVAPGSWKPAKAKRDAITRRFGPIGSCRFKVTVTARSVAGATEPATARVARLLPVTDDVLRDEGTHRTAAWRVISARGSDTTTGMLVKTAPGMHTQPPGQRVWLELIAVGTPEQPKCHGAPHRVVAGFATILATASLGGFRPR